METTTFNPGEHIYTDEKNGKRIIGMTAVNRTLWFRSVYPEGKISKQIIMDKINTSGYPIIAIEARVYAHATDARDDFLASAYSMKCYDPNDEVSQHYMECAETAAKVRALKDAGFSLPDEDALEEIETIGGTFSVQPSGEDKVVNYAEAPRTTTNQVKFWPEATEQPENQLTEEVKPVSQPTEVPTVTAPRRRGGKAITRAAAPAAEPTPEPVAEPMPEPTPEPVKDEPHMQEEETTVQPIEQEAQEVAVLPEMNLEKAKATVIRNISRAEGFFEKSFDEICHTLDEASLRTFLSWAAGLQPSSYFNEEAWAEIAAAKLLHSMMV